MFDQSDYRQILKLELEKRCQKNPRYSLRAFARALGLSSARISEILNSKSGLSGEKARQIADVLGFSEDERDYFSNLVESIHARSEIKRELALARLGKYQHRRYQSLEMSHFEVLSNWYHLAILQLLEVKGCKSEPRWIARELGIQEIEAKLALERLEGLGYIKRERGRYVASSTLVSISSSVPSEAIRNFHRQVLKKALDCVDLQSIEQRELGATILSVNRADLPLLRQMMREFRKNVTFEASKNISKDSVYCLSTQLFELTPST